ncbi:MAG: Omp28-related outer membrane protein [Bacteroidetes bacterium]|nr:Omp28-related outer membrane protein [Bacteroidota bacterium]
MKTHSIFLGITLGSFVLMHSCFDDSARELINLVGFDPASDTTYIDLDTLGLASPQPKRVYIEDFTGVKCSNCPDAAKKIEAIKETHPGRVVAMAVHAGAETFTNPKTGHSTYDFRTQDGNNIASMLHASGNLPEGAVDRKFFEGETGIITSRFVWAGNTEKRLLESIPICIDIQEERLDADTLVLLVRVLYKEAVATGEQHFLAVYLSQDSLVDYQYDIMLGDIEDYAFNHVFRASLTAYSGDSLGVANAGDVYVPGRVFQKRFVVPIKRDAAGEAFKTGWDYRFLNAVALVHKKTMDDFEVIHVVEKHLKR